TSSLAPSAYVNASNGRLMEQSFQIRRLPQCTSVWRDDPSQWLGGVRCRLLSWLKPIRYDVRVQTSNIDLGAGSYGGDEAGGRREQLDSSGTKSSNEPAKPVSGSRYMQAIAAVLLLCALASAFIVFFKGQPSAVVAALAKSGFTAAFMLIFVSEIGDKTFFIAALLAMQYQKALRFYLGQWLLFP
uniref:GDT1 family protein n=1 Tax=Aegilops tauschii subsp. strangulata TaxID=200361 RepID=A0A453AHH4_AEGTS